MGDVENARSQPQSRWPAGIAHRAEQCGGRCRHANRPKHAQHPDIIAENRHEHSENRRCTNRMHVPDRDNGPLPIQPFPRLEHVKPLIRINHGGDEGKAAQQKRKRQKK